MRTTVAALASTLAVATPALAGDPAAGERAFGQCATCHVVQNEAGEVLAGRNARQGPNLYAIAGRQAGIVEGFRYGNSIVQAGEKGLAWDEDSFVAYVLNPNTFLRDYLGDNRARGNMAFRVRSEDEARNLWAYITSLAPQPEEEAEEATTTN
ncbi:MAG: c-type cytochrome [Gemmobacter sp.]